MFEIESVIRKPCVMDAQRQVFGLLTAQLEVDDGNCCRGIGGVETRLPPLLWIARPISDNLSTTFGIATAPTFIPHGAP